MDKTELVRKRIAEALSSSLGMEMAEADEVAFHLVDWKRDLDELVKIYEKADELGDEHIQEIVIKFLAHVPNHVAAAKKLVGLGP
ncbi:MAG TPA: hypothetical protein VI479_08520, partial [Blastocatellia bacterium]